MDRAGRPSLTPSERERRAEEFFDMGYNCAQSVVLAFSDLVDVPQEQLDLLSCGLGAGIGRMREVCGAMCALAMLSGVVVSGREPRDVPGGEPRKVSGAVPEEDASGRRARKAVTYSVVQKLAARFKEENGGSIICRELLAGSGVSPSGSPEPSVRDAGYYRKRPCRGIVGTAARILAEEIGSK